MSDSLLNFCITENLGTPKQRRYLKAYNDKGTFEAAGVQLGVHRSTIASAVDRLERRATAMGYSPEKGLDRPLPKGLVLKKHSTCYIDGDKRIEWVSAEADKEKQLEMVQEAVEEIISPIKPLKRTKAPKKKQIDVDTATIYPLADLHIGLKTAKDDTGVEDWGLERAVTVVDKATSDLISHADASEVAVVANLGDFFHTDNFESRTRKSGHQLDVDGRLPSTIKVGTRLMIETVNKALAKHRKVRVVNVPGNHDDVATVALSVALELYYAKEPRVEVDTSPQLFQFFEFGRCLRGFYHGHTAPPSKLEGVLAAYFPAEWGRTSDRVVYTGHIHTQRVWELSGCLVESFSTVIPPDAWTSSMGYRARRGLCRITLHKEWGEIRRENASITRIQAFLPPNEAS